MAQPKYLDSYVEVNERIEKFYARYPKGSLQSSYEIGENLVVCKAYAYRTPDDPRPGIGHASEPIPGKTPYTKDSELMNAETSAWGRALAALGFEVKRAIASKEEVRNRQEPTGQTEEKVVPGVPDELTSNIMDAYNGLVAQMNKKDVDRIVRVKLAEMGVDKLEQMDEAQALVFHAYLKEMLID